MKIKVLLCLATVLLFFGLRLDAQIQNLNLSIECQNVAQNRDVCIKFKVSSIQQLEALQFSINYDPTVLQAVGNPTPGVCLPLLSANNIINFGNGKITFLWFADPVDVVDCEMFSICFKFIGDPGKKTTISYASSPTEILADSPLGKVNINTQSCNMEVLPNGRQIVASYCNPNVAGGNDGTIKFYGIDGVAPYTYSLINSTNGATVRTGTSADKEEVVLSGLQEGNYTINIVDGAGTSFAPKTVPMIDGGKNPKFDLEVFNPSCFSTGNGLIRIKNLDIISNNPKIEWSNGAFNVDTLDNIYNGRYSVKITDDNGCQVTKDTLLNRDTMNVSYTISQQALCNNAGQPSHRGEILLKVNGGTPFAGGGFRFVTGNSNTFLGPITTPITLQSISGGQTILRVRDNGVDAYGRSSPCEVRQIIQMPYQDTTQYSNILNIPVQCKGETNGSMEVTLSGSGNSEYRILREWNEGLGSAVTPGGGILSRTTYINNNLKAGRYYIVTESTVGQCRDTFRFTINEAIIPLRVTPTVTQPSCSTFGSIRVTAAGGQPPYTYAWEDGTTTNMRNNLNPGTYRVTVTDFNKCDTILPFVLASTSTNKVAKASVTTPVQCFNSATGAVSVDLDTAVYVWQNKLGVNVGTTKTVASLPAGSYYVTVTKDGCISQDSVLLTNPAGMIFDSIQSMLPQCAKGGIKGSLSAVISGGTPPLTYEWKNVGGTIIGTQSVLTSIDAGSYSLSVKDQNGCTRDTNISLKAPNPIVVSLIGNTVGINCFGDSTGSAFVMAIGGNITNNTRFKFFWSTGTSSSGLFDRDLNGKLVGGKNWVFAGDGICLSDTFFIDIVQREKITVAKIVKGLCGGACEGKANFITSGGTGNLSIRFDGSQLADDSIAGLCRGNYPVTVSDALGCNITDSVVINGMALDSIQAIAPQCSRGGNKGSLGAVVSGGQAPYIYEWKNVSGAVISTLSVLSSIDAGSYRLTIKDQNACAFDTAYSLLAPDPIVMSLIGNAVEVNCSGDTTGSATISATGGRIPNNTNFKFFWSTGAISSGLTDRDVSNRLIEGKNWVVAGDGVCLSDTFFIDLAPKNKITLFKEVKGICGSILCEGKAKFIPSGGVGNLSIRFNGLLQPIDSVTGLCIGRYPIEIEDELGCIIKDTVAISVNDSISLTINPDLTQNLSCKVTKGNIGIMVNGGSPNYSYKWSNNVGSITAQAMNLDQGTYTISVTDANGCSNSLSYTLVTPDSIRAVIAEPKAPKCFGGGTCIDVISVSGGVGNNYTMQINNGLRIPIDSCVNLIEGKYLVSIFDADGCKSNYDVIIPGAEPISLDLGENQSISLGEDIEEIIPIISGISNSTIKYAWNGLGSLTYRDTALKNSVIGKPSDNLFITLKITDENGCVTTDNLSIEVTRARNVFIPNIFKLTSANDENKKFDLEAGFGVEEVEELLILDRWGNTVYQKKNYIPDVDSGWDGSFNGTTQNPGVFVYAARVRFIDGEIKVYKGDITLLK